VGGGVASTVAHRPAGPPRPARPGRRAACHRSPWQWRPGCSCPMIT